MKTFFPLLAGLALCAACTQAPAPRAAPAPSPTPSPTAHHRVVAPKPKPKKTPAKYLAGETTPNPPSAFPSATPAPTVANYPSATKVEGKSGRVTSPYAPGAGEVDVSGMPPGAEVKDPYTGKIFLTP